MSSPGSWPRHLGLRLGDGARVASSGLAAGASSEPSETVVERSGVPPSDPDHGVRIEVGRVRAVGDERLPRLGRPLARRAGRRPGHGRRGAAHGARRANGLRLHLIANSHGHIDHIFDNAPLMRASEAPLAIHPDDAYRLDGRNNYGFEIEAGRRPRATCARASRSASATSSSTSSTRPGHTEGSVCLYEERRGLLLAGDVLFAGSYGRTDLPGGNDEQMVASLARLAREIPPSRPGAARPRRRDDDRRASCPGCDASPRPGGSSLPG